MKCILCNVKIRKYYEQNGLYLPKYKLQYLGYCCSSCFRISNKEYIKICNIVFREREKFIKNHLNLINLNSVTIL